MKDEDRAQWCGLGDLCSGVDHSGLLIMMMFRCLLKSKTFANPVIKLTFESLRFMPCTIRSVYIYLGTSLSRLDLITTADNCGSVINMHVRPSNQWRLIKLHVYIIMSSGSHLYYVIVLKRTYRSDSIRSLLAHIHLKKNIYEFVSLNASF